jgi:hypothetical protein
VRICYSLKLSFNGSHLNGAVFMTTDLLPIGSGSKVQVWKGFFVDISGIQALKKNNENLDQEYTRYGLVFFLFILIGYAGIF